MKLDRQLIVSGMWAAAALMPSLVASAATPAAEAVAPTQLQPVQIAAPALPPIRLDVRAACPAIEGDLQKFLSPAWGRVGLAGTMKVEFRVENQQVTDVSSVGISADYRPYVRRAVRNLACQVASASVQDFRFLLVIRDPDEVPAPERFALKDAD